MTADEPLFFASMPRPAVCLVISFGLGRQSVFPYIVSAVQPYPGHGNHPTPIERLESIDNELMAWLDDAYGFTKRNGQ